MFCPKCGNKLSENDKFCYKCGTKVEKQETNNSIRSQLKRDNTKYRASKVTGEQLQGNSYPQKTELWFFLVCSAVYPYLFLMDITHFFGIKRYFERYYAQMYGYGTYNYFYSTGTASDYYVLVLITIPVFYETYFITKFMERFNIIGIKPKVIAFIILFIGTIISNGLVCELAPFSVFAISYAMKNKFFK